MILGMIISAIIQLSLVWGRIFKCYKTVCTVHKSGMLAQEMFSLFFALLHRYHQKTEACKTSDNR